MGDGKLETFGGHLDGAIARLGEVERDLARVSASGTLSPKVLQDVEAARQAANHAVSEARNVLRSIDGIRAIIIKPVAQQARLGTRFTLVFGVVGVLGALVGVLPAVVDLTTPKPAQAAENTPTTPPPKRSKRPFLPAGADELLQDQMELEGLKALLAKRLLTATDEEKDELRKIATSIGDTPGLTDVQLELMRSAYATALDGRPSIATLEAIKDDELSADRELLLAILRQRSGKLLSAAGALGRIEGDSWLGVAESVPIEVADKVLSDAEAAVRAQPALARELGASKELQALIRSRIAQKSAVVFNAAAKSTTDAPLVARMERSGFRQGSTSRAPFPGGRQWPDSYLYYSVGHRLAAEYLGRALASVCVLKVAPIEKTESTTVKRTRSEFVLVVGMNCD